MQPQDAHGNDQQADQQRPDERATAHIGRRTFLAGAGSVLAASAAGVFSADRASAAPAQAPWQLPEPGPANAFYLMPIADEFTSQGADVFRTEMKNMISQFGGRNIYQRLGFSFIPRGRDQLMSAAKIADDLGMHLGPIMPYQCHSGGAHVTQDLRTYQWRLNGTWRGPTSNPRDRDVPSPSRYNTATRDLLAPDVASWASYVLATMAAYPGVITVVNGVIEEELALGGQDVHYLADYSPFAVAEFRDWLTHRGAYDADGGTHAGQGAPAEIVGTYLPYQGKLRSPFYADPSPAQARPGHRSFNDWFGTDFSTWALRYWDLDRYPNPIPIPGTQGWQAGSNVASVSVVDSFAEGPGRPHGGTSCLQALSAAAPADAWRTVAVTPAQALDLSAGEQLLVWVDGYGGAPAATGYEASLTLISDGDRLQQTLSSFQSNQWNRVSVDLRTWAHREHVTGIEVGFRATGSDAVWGGNFHVDDMTVVTATGSTVLYDFEADTFSTMPQSGAGFTAGGFDAPRTLDASSRFWNAWSWDYPDHDNSYPPGNPEHPAFGFRQCEVHHFVMDMFDLLAKAGVPRDLLFAHQIPGEVVSGDGMGAGAPRCRSSASPIWTGYLPLNAHLGITRFGPIDPDLLLQYSDNWGIFEWHPDPGAAPTSQDLYDKASHDLHAYQSNRAHVLFPGWWGANGQINPTFPLNDSTFATAIADFLQQTPDVPYSRPEARDVQFTPPPVRQATVTSTDASTDVVSWSARIWSSYPDTWPQWRQFSVFEVATQTDDDGPWHTVLTRQTSATFTSRLPTASYTYRVRARSRAGFVGPWVTASANTGG